MGGAGWARCYLGRAGAVGILVARVIVFLVGGTLLAGLILASWNTADGVIFTSIDAAQALLAMGVLGFMGWSGFSVRKVDTATAEVDDASYRAQFSIRDVLALTTLIAAWSAAYGYLKPPRIIPSEAFVVVLFGGCFAIGTILSVLATLAARRTVIALMVAWTTSAARRRSVLHFPGRRADRHLHCDGPRLGRGSIRGLPDLPPSWVSISPAKPAPGSRVIAARRPVGCMHRPTFLSRLNRSKLPEPRKYGQGDRFVVPSRSL